MSNYNPIKSVYRRGADDGFFFGIYLSLMLLATFYSVSGPSMLSGLFSFAMIIGVPAVIYFFIRRGYKADHCRSQFSAMWLHGICIFFFGSLLMALTSYIYLRLINPAFISNMLEIARQTYAGLGTADANTIVNMIEQVQRTNAYPTAGGIAVEIIWLAVFTGSLLSMLLSLIIRAINRPQQTPPPPPVG